MGIWGWAVVLLWAFVAAGCCVLYQLLVQNGRTLLRLEALEKRLIEQGILPEQPEVAVTGLPVGTVLNDFSLPLLAGGTMTLSQWRGRRVLLVFFNPGCGFCQQMLAQLAESPPPTSDPAPLIVSTGDPEENKRLFERYPIPYPVLLQEDAELSSLYRVTGTPTGYVIGKDGATATEILVGGDTLLAAMRAQSAPGPSGRKVSRSLAESRLVRDGLKAGTRAPRFSLPSLDGAELALNDFRGRPMLLVFSDPACQPCQRLAPELERIHRSAAGPEVLMISRGDLEANRAKAAEHHLTFPIVLQRHWEISRAYGMFATPSAYLLDGEGTLASDVAVGGEAILDLVSRSVEERVPETLVGP